MARKKYLITKKGADLITQTLSSAQEIRNTLDPLLLEKARHAIGIAIERCHDVPTTVSNTNSVSIDHKKNLMVIMEYMKLNPQNKTLHHRIQSFLTEH